MPVSIVPVVNTLAQHVTAEDLQNKDIQARVVTLKHNYIADSKTQTSYCQVMTSTIIRQINSKSIWRMEIPKMGMPMMNEADTIDDYDMLVGATFLLNATQAPRNVTTKATAIKRKTNMHGKPLGHPRVRSQVRRWNL